MKKQNQSQSSSATRRTATAKFILTGMIAAAASFALPASSHAQISAFPFTLDGLFSAGGEWSDVAPVSFLSTAGGTTPTTPALANTQLYAAISHNVASPGNDLQLHLLYDFLPRTLPPLAGEIFATVTFPVTLGAQPRRDISVVFQGNGGPSFFDIFVDLEVTNPANPLTPIAAFPGLLGDTKAGPSPLSGTPHLIVELEVPLRIPVGFGTGAPGELPGGGINPATGMYDPDPVFWGAAAGGDGTGSLASFGGPVSSALLQPATTVIIGINPNGSLAITPVPEPSTAILLLGSLAMLGARRRKSASAA